MTIIAHNAACALSFKGAFTKQQALNLAMEALFSEDLTELQFDAICKGVVAALDEVFRLELTFTHAGVSYPNIRTFLCVGGDETEMESVWMAQALATKRDRDAALAEWRINGDQTAEAHERLWAVVGPNQTPVDIVTF